MNKKLKIYAEDIINVLQFELLPQDREYKITIEEMHKNNENLTAVLIRDLSSQNGDIGFAPCIYVNDFYKNGFLPEDAAAEIKDIYYAASKKISAEANDVSDFLKYKPEKVSYVLRSGNKDNINFFKDKLYKPLPGTDLCKVYVKKMDELNGLMYLQNDIINKWRIDKEGLDKQAELNVMSDCIFINISDALFELTGMNPTPAPMWIASNTTFSNGAAVIASPKVRQDIKKQFGENFYILPSSVHEVICISESDVIDNDNCGIYKELNEIVKKVNSNVVTPQERLSDNIYYSDGENICLAQNKDNLNKDITSETGLETE